MRTGTTQRQDNRRHGIETIWSPIESAAVAELVDLGVSYAAPGLRALTGTTMDIRCEPITACSRRDAAHLLKHEMPGPVDAVSKPFAGSFAGALTLIVPENARRLVEGPAADEPIADGHSLGAFTRFADVLLTHCLAEVEGTLGLILHPHVTRLDQGFPYDVVVPVGASLEDQLFPFSLDIELGRQSATTVLTVDVERASTGALKRYLREFLDADGCPEREAH